MTLTHKKQSNYLRRPPFLSSVGRQLQINLCNLGKEVKFNPIKMHAPSLITLKLPIKKCLTPSVLQSSIWEEKQAFLAFRGSLRLMFKKRLNCSFWIPIHQMVPRKLIDRFRRNKKAKKQETSLEQSFLQKSIKL